MANLVDKSGDAYSNVVHGDGSNSLTFTMPGNVSLGVESVVATVDNTNGGDTTALLTVRDPSGRVIATKRQGAPVLSGDTGTATWALRLTDEAPNFATGGAEFVAIPAITTLLASTSTSLPWSHFRGAHWLEYSTPQVPSFIHSGVYAVTVSVTATGPTPTTLQWTLSLFAGNQFGLPGLTIDSNGWTTGINPATSYITVSKTAPALAGEHAIVLVGNPGGASRDFSFVGVVQRLA